MYIGEPLGHRKLLVEHWAVQPYVQRVSTADYSQSCMHAHEHIHVHMHIANARVCSRILKKHLFWGYNILVGDYNPYETYTGENKNGINTYKYPPRF